MLGHNGAGKSTLIGCLIGMIEKDSGEIWMNQNVGVCLQFDMSYEELTVLDNMKVINGLKGVSIYSGEMCTSLCVYHINI